MNWYISPPNGEYGVTSIGSPLDCTPFPQDVHAVYIVPVGHIEIHGTLVSQKSVSPEEDKVDMPLSNPPLVRIVPLF